MIINAIKINADLFCVGVFFSAWSWECLSWTIDSQLTTFPFLKRWEVLRLVPQLLLYISVGALCYITKSCCVTCACRTEWRNTFSGTLSKVWTWFLMKSCGDGKKPSVMEWCQRRSPGTPTSRNILNHWYVLSSNTYFEAEVLSAAPFYRPQGSKHGQKSSGL